MTSGRAQDIGIGSDGSVFIVSLDGAKLGRYSNQRKKFIDFPGELIKVAVSPDGNPWGVNNLKEVFRHNGKDWIQVKGASAIDIGIGADRTVFVTDVDEVLFRFEPTLNRFKRYPGVKGLRVAVDPKGRPWTINSVGRIRRCDSQPCATVPRKGIDISIGPDGSVFLVDQKKDLLRFDFGINNWKKIPAVKFDSRLVSVGPNGRPWVVDVNGRVYVSTFFDRDEEGDLQVAQRTIKRTTTIKKSIFTFIKNIKFEEADTSALASVDFADIDIGVEGSIFLLESGLDPNNTKFYKFDDRTDKFEEITKIPPEGGSAIAVDPDGELWSVNFNTLNVYEQQGNSFKKRTGLGTTGNNSPDLAVGGEGSVFAIDKSGQVYKFNAVKKKFKKFVNGTYSRIAVDPLGIPWVTDTNGVLYQFDGKKFVQRSTGSDKFGDVSVGADGSVFARTSATGAIRRWNQSNQKFDDLSNGLAERIAVDPSGRPWFIKSGNIKQVFRPKK